MTKRNIFVICLIIVLLISISACDPDGWRDTGREGARVSGSCENITEEFDAGATGMYTIADYELHAGGVKLQNDGPDLTPGPHTATKRCTAGNNSYVYVDGGYLEE